MDPVAAMLVQRKLNSRDKAMREGFRLPPGAETEALSQDLTPGNIQQLGEAIDRAKDPRQRAILMRELDRLKGLASNLVGPIQPPPMMPGIPPNGAQRAPYVPAEQAPGIFGGQRMSSPPTPGSM